MDWSYIIPVVLEKAVPAAITAAGTVLEKAVTVAGAALEKVLDVPASIQALSNAALANSTTTVVGESISANASFVKALSTIIVCTVICTCITTITVVHLLVIRAGRPAAHLHVE